MKKAYKIGLLALASLVILTLVIPNPFSKRFYSSFNLKEGSNKGRIEMWSKAGEVVLNNPLLGVGIGNYPLEVKPTASYREPIYAHNTYLDIAAETGIPNTLIWIGLLLFSALSFLKKSKQDIIFLGVFLSLVVFSVHSLVETAIYSPVVLTLFLLIISFNYADPNEKHPKAN